MNSILVTGGAGFIGSHTVVELYKAGYTPVIIDDFSNSHPKVLQGIESIIGEAPIFYQGDCSDVQFLISVLAKHPDICGCIHFAAFKAVGESVLNPLKYYQNNIGSLSVLLNALREYKITQLVFSSSCTVYGQPTSLPVDENASIEHANSPYGYTKQVCERMICDVHASVKGLSSAVLRYFNPIGAHASGLIGELPLGTPDNLVPFITQSAAGLRDGLTIFGNDYNTPDGTCIRDYIHVVDLAKAHVAALTWTNNNPNSCEAFNIGTGKGNSVKEVIDTFELVNDLKLKVAIGERRPGDVEQIYASGLKAKELLKWTPELSLADALIDAWRWQQNLSVEA
ncbi:MAG: UDP-glucose 4-epimerase GalE [Flavobacteriales bacterium]|nr:UDP-glucose 4-epimerase GalE [Flavobacteriales bacterium]MDG1766551.1 UDP-glucose 4-epimerase GalE [Flavobacteriales bacterium]